MLGVGKPGWSPEVKAAMGIRLLSRSSQLEGALKDRVRVMVGSGLPSAARKQGWSSEGGAQCLEQGGSKEDRK